MRYKHLRTIIIFGSFVLLCLSMLQYYWFRKAFDVSERQFDHTVQIALKRVADTVSRKAEIKKLSSNFFFVQTNSGLKDKTVDSLVRKEFLSRGLRIDYELGIYKADDDTLVYGNYIPATAEVSVEPEAVDDIESIEKNFAVYFPSRKAYLATQLDVWIFSSAVLLLMMFFFSYAIVSLLRERRFSELKNDFINNMTHEFKTPVTNIQIAGEILKNKMTDEATRVYVDILMRENNKLREKIDRVLLGASYDYRRKPAFETIDVHKLIEDCAETFELKLKERNGRIGLQFDARTTLILADRELLADAINNVIDNAEKFSPCEPRILVKTRDVEKGIEINIIDRGIGVERRLAKKVFDKFFRVTSGNVHNVKGFGLGLNFVREVVRSHHGEVRLISELNKGTEVKIFLPHA